MATATRKKRSKKRTQYATDDRGRIRLYVGYWINSKGQRVQRPFFFGADPHQVPARLARVNELWQHIVDEWETVKIRSRRLGADPTARDGKPVWSSDAIWIASQLASGKVQIPIERGSVTSTPAHPQTPTKQAPINPTLYAESLRGLAKRYPMVHFVPEDEQAAAGGGTVLEAAREHQLAQLNERFGLPENLLPRKSQSLHEALDAYYKTIDLENQEPTEIGPRLSAWGVVRQEYAARLKDHHANCPLSALDFDGCQRLIDYWRNRPVSKKTGKPFADKYCKHHIDELKRFFKSTSKAKGFDWRKPEDFDELQTKVRKISSEKTAIPSEKVTVHTVEELTLLYQYGSDIERALMLLGLNCGSRGAEMGTTEERHLFLSGHPHTKWFNKFPDYDVRKGDAFLLYSRHKSDGDNYGEFLLWPETAKAIEYMLDRKRKKGFGDVPYLLVTENGQPFYRRTAGNKNSAQIFANKWGKLHQRILADHPKHRWLPFGTFRDTGSDWMRHIGGGEVASCYEMHRTTTSDNLLDLYSNRPYGHVFKALREMRQQLAPMFNAAPDAFE